MNAFAPQSSTRARIAAGTATIALAACGLVAGAQPASAGTVTRIEGTDRIDTAIKVWEQNRGLYAADRAVIARFDNYADSLSATPGAAASKSPILLNQRDQLDPRVLAALKANGVVNVGIMGGPNAISPAVEAELKANGFNTLRVGGVDRFETARLAASAYMQATGKTTLPVYVATGLNFPDALASGAAAAKAGGVVLLSKGKTLDSATAAMVKGSASSVVAVGGAASTAVKAAGINASPVVGTTRYETATLLAEREWTNPADVVVASGQTFADSLAGGVLAALKDGPLLLTPPTRMNPHTEGFLVKYKPNVILLGGFAAVSANTGDDLVAAASGKPSSALATALRTFAGQTLTGTSTTAVTGGTLTTNTTVTVNADGTYTVDQDFSVTAGGTVPTSESRTLITLLKAPDGREAKLTQLVTWNSSASFPATGTASAQVVTTPSGTTMSNPTWQLTSGGAAPEGTTVKASVVSSIDGAAAGAATATSTYTNGDWSTPVFYS